MFKFIPAAVELEISRPSSTSIYLDTAHWEEFHYRLHVPSYKFQAASFNLKLGTWNLKLH
jgi:hypothetical protein